MAERRKTRKVRPRLREGTTAKETAVGGQGVTWPRREPDRVPGGADAVADRQGRAKASPSACFLFSPHCPLSGTGGVPWQRGEEECEGLLQDSGRKHWTPGRSFAGAGRAQRACPHRTMPQRLVNKTHMQTHQVYGKRFYLLLEDLP